MVAALYVDPRGPYPSMRNVDCWDAARDARLYDGPHPVVAHPPCGPWGGLRHLYRGNEHDCGPAAVAAVRRFGGVLEHPRRSKLWEACGLPVPGEPCDQFGGLTIEIDQCAWGHVARKPTWLYVVGVARDVVLAGVRTGGTPTHWTSGGRAHDRKGSGGFAPPGIKICSAQQRRRTPTDLAEWLVALARSASPEAM